jgi:hypothetical protein
MSSAALPWRPVFVKQLGTQWSVDHGHGHKHGGDPKQWSKDLRVREMPRPRTRQRAARP